MSKRPLSDDHFARKSKQRRREDDDKSKERKPKKSNPNYEVLGARNTEQTSNGTASEVITSTRQLHTLLAFQESDVPAMRNGKKSMPDSIFR